MKLLLSNFPPAKFPSVLSAKNIFEKNLEASDYIMIASGYISASSLIELQRIIQINRRPKIDLLIGMHYFDGFTTSQYNAAVKLNESLRLLNLGSLYVSQKIKFHGKVCCYFNNKIPTSGVVGSSNFSSLLSSSERLYEVDYLINEPQDLTELNSHITGLFKNLSTRFENVNIQPYEEMNDLLINHYAVKTLTNQEKSYYWENKDSNKEFDIPLKTTPRSNLNVFFGKGRENKSKKFILPRPWYEVEIIVPNSITSKKGYPKNCIFKVITDDGWMFNCKTSGDYSKNFRSADDLTILGKWIKGRLEKAGVLTIGTEVTAETLINFGMSKLKLIATNNTDIWLLRFN